MGVLQEDPHRALILGAGHGGSGILSMLLEEDLVSVVGMADINPEAEGLSLAREQDIPVYTNTEQALRECAPCVAFNLTGNEMVESVASEILGVGGVIGGLQARLMLNMMSNLKHARDELHFHASHDVLTGLYNRRHMMEMLQQGVSQAIRYRHAFTIVMIDIDHFKLVNDEHGHASGDMVLREMSRVLGESVRDADIAGRWGGEEFLVLLPHTDLTGAAQAAEQWLKRIKASPVALKDGVLVKISFSAGVAMLQPGQKPEETRSVLEALLQKADDRMYQSKARGRSRICIGDD